MHRGGHDDLQQQTGEQQKEVLLEERKVCFCWLTLHFNLEFSFVLSDLTFSVFIIILMYHHPSYLITVNRSYHYHDYCSL